MSATDAAPEPAFTAPPWIAMLQALADQAERDRTSREEQQS